MIFYIFVFVPGIVKYCCRLLFKFIFDLCVICSSLLLPVYTILSSMFPHVFLGLCSTYFPKTLVREELSILYPGRQQQGSGARVLLKQVFMYASPCSTTHQITTSINAGRRSCACRTLSTVDRSRTSCFYLWGGGTRGGGCTVQGL